MQKTAFHGRFSIRAIRRIRGMSHFWLAAAWLSLICCRQLAPAQSLPREPNTAVKNTSWFLGLPDDYAVFVSVSTDQRTVNLIRREGVVFSLDSVNGRVLSRRLEQPASRPCGVAIAQTGKIALWVDWVPNLKLMLHHLESNAQSQIGLPGEERFSCCCFSADSSVIGIALEKTVCLFKTNPFALIKTVRPGVEKDQTIIAICLSNDAQQFACATTSGLVAMGNVGKDDKPVELRCHDPRGNPPLNAVCFSKDSRRLVAGGRGATLHVIDAQKFREIASVDTESSLYSLAFSPDDKELAAGLVDARILFFDPSTWKCKNATCELFSGEEALEEIHSLAYLADSTKLICGTLAGTVAAWDSSTGKLLWKRMLGRRQEPRKQN
jgi:WD40 repeat protein